MCVGGGVVATHISSVDERVTEPRCASALQKGLHTGVSRAAPQIATDPRHGIGTSRRHRVLGVLRACARARGGSCLCSSSVCKVECVGMT